MAQQPDVTLEKFYTAIRENNVTQLKSLLQQKGSVSAWALNEAGVMHPDAKGVRFLLGTQAADGSWHVVSRATKFQQYFESGFPYGHDQWISTMATGWAANALALSLGQ